MESRKTIGEMMEEMRLKAGAKEYAGHSYMDLNRFADDTRHMIIFDVLTDDSPIGWKDVYKRQEPIRLSVLPIFLRLQPWQTAISRLLSQQRAEKQKRRFAV